MPVQTTVVFWSGFPCNMHMRYCNILPHTGKLPVGSVFQVILGQPYSQRKHSAIAGVEKQLKELIISGTFSKLQKDELCSRAIACSKHKEYWQGIASQLVRISEKPQRLAVDQLDPAREHYG
jgi:hypothetical protein